MSACSPSRVERSISDDETAKKLRKKHKKTGVPALADKNSGVVKIKIFDKKKKQSSSIDFAELYTNDFGTGEGSSWWKESRIFVVTYSFLLLALRNASACYMFEIHEAFHRNTKVLFNEEMFFFLTFIL